MSSNKEVRAIIKEALRQGWEVDKSKKHISFYPPSAEKDIIVMSGTPSSPRNFKNVISLLRKNGLKL